MVTLYLCGRCRLRWVKEVGREVCPACRRQSRMPSYPVIVAGEVVEVKETILHGDDTGLKDSRVRRGLDSLILGQRCKHGLITWRLCPMCNKNYDPQTLTICI